MSNGYGALSQSGRLAWFVFCNNNAPASETTRTGIEIHVMARKILGILILFILVFPIFPCVLVLLWLIAFHTLGAYAA